MAAFSSRLVIKKAWAGFKQQWLFVLQLSILYVLQKLLFGDTQTTWSDLSSFGIKESIFFGLEHLLSIFPTALFIRLAILSYEEQKISWKRILDNISDSALRLGIFSTIFLPITISSNEFLQNLNTYQPILIAVLSILICTIDTLLHFARYDYVEHVSHSFKESLGKGWQIVIRSNWRIVTCLMSAFIISLYFIPLYLLGLTIALITKNTLLEIFTESLWPLWITFSLIYIYKESSNYSFKK